jgi:ribosomal protein S24E
MKSEIISDEKNLFFNRNEMTLSIESDTQPNYEDIRKEIGKDENLINIRKIENNFGRKKFTAYVDVYDSVEDKNKIMTIPKKVRKKMEAEEVEKKKVEEAEKKKAEEEKAREVEEASSDKVEEAEKENVKVEVEGDKEAVVEEKKDGD